MKGSRWLFILAASLFASVANAQPPAPKPPPEMAHLKALEGRWAASVKMPGAPEPSRGIMNYRMGLGGMWLTSDFKALFGGQNFFGQGFDSYDPAKKKYVSVWVDSMETSPMVMEGELDKDGKILTMTGEGPGQDGKTAKYKSVSELKDKDHMVFKLFTVEKDGKDKETLTIEYQRSQRPRAQID